ncbi:unnamed protein product [Rotaria sordida]|uniref:Uncharacterized protein n=2 Tax=Rotaria sordida TaxID=392033 RepID=A0A819DXA5_9BILA|nr:unnamed protein product [Rotaria sordida]
MSYTRKRTSRLKQRLLDSHRRQSTLHALIDVFNYAGANISPRISSLSLSTTNDIPSSSLLLPSTSQVQPNDSPHKSCYFSSFASLSTSSSSSSLLSLSDCSDNSDNDSCCSINNEIFKLTNTESSTNTYTKLFTDDDVQNRSEPLTSKEIAVLLVQLRCRHALTKACITHICQLLQVLKVPNAPSSFDSIESQRCTNLNDCVSKQSFIRSPTTNYTFAIEPQVRSILERNQIFPKLNHHSISDITDGQFYEKLLRKESESFVTLLMNSDGGLIKAISKSIWCTTFVINELPRAIRFLPENTIIGMVSTGSMKPKKGEMLSMMNDLGYKLTNSNKTLAKSAAKEYLQGVKGPCLLRQLKYFNIYNSFLCDTLHNLYSGVMGKMLKLFLSKQSITEGISNAMSVYDQIDNIAEIVNSISYPSTTYRQPRDIRLFKKFKANELRIILLFGYSAFENFLDEERFIHLKVLAFIAHLVEGESSFARTIHGGSTPTRELIKNIDLYRQSSMYVSSTSFPASGREYIDRIFSSPREITFNYRDDLHNIKLYQEITSPPSSFFQKWPNSSESNFLLYKTLFFDNLRFSADDFTILRRSNDSCILYKTKKNSYSVGFISYIVHIIDRDEICLVLNKVKITSTADTLNIDGRNFMCNNILKGSVVSDSTAIIQPSQISKKVAFRPILDEDPSLLNTFIFYQYPNLKECT